MAGIFIGEVHVNNILIGNPGVDVSRQGGSLEPDLHVVSAVYKPEKFGMCVCGCKFMMPVLGFIPAFFWSFA